jgi:hypothetical protein
MKPVILQAGHYLRARTNNPIFGILTQPIPRAWMQDEFIKVNGWNTFFESSHADFLQAGGARVVPIDYRLSDKELKDLLTNLNGLYIPGDTKDCFDDY